MIKNSIIAVLLIIIAALAYQRYISLDENLSKGIALKEQCFEVGEKIHAKMTNDFKENSNFSMLRSEYTYNDDLDTCLYWSGAIGSSENGELVSQQWVVDSYTNEEILTYMNFNGHDYGLSLEEFETKKKELFNN